MLPLTLIRRPLTPAQADAIMRRAWIVPACFYAVGGAAALVFVALIALDFPALGLRYGLAIVCILLVAFIPAAVAYSRAPSRRPRIAAITSRQEERTVTELLITGDTTFARSRAAGIAWGLSGIAISLIPLAFSSSTKNGFLMSLGTGFLIIYLLVKVPDVYFPREHGAHVQMIILVPDGFAIAEKDFVPCIETVAWSYIVGMGETFKGATAIHYTKDGEDSVLWLRFSDPGLSYVAIERLIDYFASNPRRRRVLGTETGVDVVRALLRGQDPDA